MTDAPNQTTGRRQPRIYVAGRATAERKAMWRRLRADGFPIISSWIDEDDAPESYADLWRLIEFEVASATVLLFYAEPDDLPVRGALVEVGMALAAGVPVVAVLPGVDLDERTWRPIGSWLAHPDVMIPETLDIALASITRGAVNVAA